MDSYVDRDTNSVIGIEVWARNKILWAVAMWVIYKSMWLNEITKDMNRESKEKIQDKAVGSSNVKRLERRESNKQTEKEKLKKNETQRNGWYKM